MRQYGNEIQLYPGSDGKVREVILAEHAGFCFGVQRAVDAVYDEIGRSGDIYTYGPVIHNDIVVRDLEKRGVRIISSEDEIDAVNSGTVIIRSHGVSRAIFEKLSNKPGIKLIDMTCPFVQRIHRIVDSQSRSGKRIVIIGNVGHAEVVGHMEWSVSPVDVIETREEAEAFDAPPETPLCIVAQTTFHSKKFEEFVAILNNKGYNNFYVENTVCNATGIRQQEAALIASRVDVMIVIGGKNSSNSAKLFEICKKECERTYFIQSLEELDLKLTPQDRSIGITAGASTPKNIIEEVQRYVGTGTDI